MSIIVVNKSRIQRLKVRGNGLTGNMAIHYLLYIIVTDPDSKIPDKSRLLNPLPFAIVKMSVFAGLL